MNCWVTVPRPKFYKILLQFNAVKCNLQSYCFKNNMNYCQTHLQSLMMALQRAPIE